MSKKKVIIITAAAMVIVSIAVWLIVRQKRKGTDNTLQRDAGSTTGSTTTKWTIKNLDDSEIDWPIKRGDAGTIVTNIQNGLNSKYGAGLVVDGKFGAKTEAALLKYFGKKELTESDFAVFTVKTAQ